MPSQSSPSDNDILREYASRWSFLAHEGQIPPEGDWSYYLMRSGRGGGKTRAGAEWILKRVRQGYKSIALVGANAADVRDSMIELGESSIMKVARPDEMPIFEPSKRRLTFPNGAVAVAFSDEKPDALRGPQHDTCFVHGSMILSPHGTIPIQEINRGDFVLTRAGYKPILATSNRIGTVGRVRFSNGSELVGTAEHPVWTSNGWVPLGDLKVGDTVCASIGENGPTGTSSDTKTAKQSINTDVCGRLQTDPWLKDTTSTTKTKTRRITNSQTSNALHPSPTETTTTKLQDESNSPVLTVGQKLHILERTTAPQSVRNVKLTGQNVIEKLTKSVSIVGGRSFPDRGTIAVSVVSTWALVGRKRVYNLSVGEQPEYFSNNILVHNCWVDELAKFKYPQETWDNLMFGLRLGDNPQVFITTTPRPIPIIKKLLKHPKTIDVRFSTFSNAENLSPKFLAEVKELYEGTRLGRQELEGEMLEDNPGALWQRDIIEHLRVREAPSMYRVVVAVDPAVTSGTGADETGIIVAGIASNGHCYVLADKSIQGTPHAWALATSKAYYSEKADRVIGEVNNGGELVEVNLRTVNKTIPFRAVHASRGKQIRAEPISSLYEKGTVHHVGTFPQLEDQMCEWVPGDPSPDRMDALVYAITALTGKGAGSSGCCSGPLQGAKTYGR